MKRIWLCIDKAIKFGSYKKHRKWCRKCPLQTGHFQDSRVHIQHWVK